MAAGSLLTSLGAFLEKAECLLARYLSKRCLLHSVDQDTGKSYDILVNKMEKHELNPGELGAILSNWTIKSQEGVLMLAWRQVISDELKGSAHPARILTFLSVIQMSYPWNASSHKNRGYRTLASLVISGHIKKLIAICHFLATLNSPSWAYYPSVVMGIPLELPGKWVMQRWENGWSSLIPPLPLPAFPLYFSPGTPFTEAWTFRFYLFLHIFSLFTLCSRRCYDLWTFYFCYHILNL